MNEKQLERLAQEAYPLGSHDWNASEQRAFIAGYTAAKKEDAVGKKFDRFYYEAVNVNDELPTEEKFYLTDAGRCWYQIPDKSLGLKPGWQFGATPTCWLRELGSPPPAEPLDEGKEIAIDWDALYLIFQKEMFDINDGDDERQDVWAIFNWFKTRPEFSQLKSNHG